MLDDEGKKRGDDNYKTDEWFTVWPRKLKKRRKQESEMEGNTKHRDI